jgi:hypothetical protein
MFCLQLIESHLDGGNGNHAFSQFDVICSNMGPYLHVMTWVVIKGVVGPFRPKKLIAKHPN